MRNRKKIFLYISLVVLVVVKLVTIVNVTYVIDTAAKYNLFISSSIADGLFPHPEIFKLNIAYAGGGHFIYSLLSVPFILIFGKSYFSLRLVSILFLVFTYILVYKFLNKYFNFKTAVFGSLLFIITSGLISSYSIVGEGRHFQYNLFFISSLYLFTYIKEKHNFLSYLAFGTLCGLGLYFFPAFLVTIFIFLFFLIAEINVKRLSTVFHLFIVIVMIVLGAEFLKFNSSWYSTIYHIVTSSPKGIRLHGNILDIIMRFFTIIFKSLPNLYSFSPNRFMDFFNQPFNYYYHHLFSLRGMALEMFRVVFVFSFFFFIFVIRRKSVKWLKSVSMFLEENKVSIKNCILVFLFTHLIIYTFLFSFNAEDIQNCKYYLPLFLNMIFIISISLNWLWERNRYVSITLLIFALLPGIIFQIYNFKVLPNRIKNFDRHYTHFYEPKAAMELIDNKPIRIHKKMSRMLNINVSHTIGEFYGYENNINSVEKKFKYISEKKSERLKYLYQGYIKNKVLRRDGKIKKVISIIKKVDKEYLKFCYIGLGEGFCALSDLYRHSAGKELNIKNFNLKKHRKKIRKVSLLVPDEYKKYFFQGIGEGVAKGFAKPYISDDKGKFYNADFLNNYLNTLPTNGNKRAFLKGYLNKDIWNEY